MEKIIKYLIYALKTVDGKKNSALPFIKTMNRQSIKKLQEKQGLRPINSVQMFEID